ncbi:MAG: SUMF1/EgtB/PvdO family nonheme iron enzyme [Planctomycetota bacterium]
MTLKNLIFLRLVAALFVATASLAQAAVPVTVPVGNPGNAADTTGFGAVAYAYQIGKFEVTLGEYCEFLNAAAKTDEHELYDPRMEKSPENGWSGIKRSGDSGSYTYAIIASRDKQPVGYVTWESCIRYVNWLSNGQGKGDTEKGTYEFGADGVKVSDHAALAKGTAAKWVMTSENEWYKAAYYDASKQGGAGYWQFPAKSDTAPAANINSNWPTEAGKFKDSASPYGTFDQGGNVWEYNDSQADGKVGLRGGSWYINDKDDYERSFTRYNVLSAKWPHRGFRVAQLGGDASK